MNLFYKITYPIIYCIFKVFYRHRVFGTKNIVNGAAIIAPNHLSFLDPPLVAISCPEPVAFLAKDTLFRKPLLGTIIRKLYAFPVSGKIKDLASIKIILGILKKNKKVIVFPEGIRTHDGQLAQIKPGICMLALRANAPIIPAYIKGTYEIWPRKRSYPKPWGKTVCAFGKPVYPDTYKDMDKKEAQEAMAQEVRKRIQELSQSQNPNS